MEGLQRYSQSRWLPSYQPFPKCHRKERPTDTVPASGSHSQPMDTFLFHRNCTSGNHGTTGNRDTSSFVNSAVSGTGRARLIRTWLVRSFTLSEVSVKCFPIISCLKCMVNPYFHLIRSKTLPTKDFLLTVPDLLSWEPEGLSPRVEGWGGGEGGWLKRIWY